MKAYSTREVADLLGISATRVRALVRSGVVKPQRDAAGHAAFSFQDLVFLRVVARLALDARDAPAEDAAPVGGPGPVAPDAKRHTCQGM